MPTNPTAFSQNMLALILAGVLAMPFQGELACRFGNIALRVWGTCGHLSRLPSADAMLELPTVLKPFTHSSRHAS